jgi:DNA polymerase-1
METSYKVITTSDELRDAVATLAKYPVIGFDTETTELDPYKGRVRLVQLGTPEGFTYIFDLDRFAAGDLRKVESLEPLRKLLSARQPVKIAHNAKFDAKWIRHHLSVELGGEYDSWTCEQKEVERGGLFDTLLASQIVSAGDTEDRHSLQLVVERYLNEEMDKSAQLSDWSGELSASQLEYAARDAAIMIPLRERLVERIKADSLGRVAQLEFECVVPIAGVELAGVFLDTACWREQIAVVQKKRAVLADELQGMLAEGATQGLLFADARVDINLDSHTQLSAALKRLGIPLPDSTRNWKLQPLAADYPVIAKLLEYRTVQKSLTSYGENIINEISPKTGRIHANFHQIGAPTGRMACTNPNVQQVPHAVEYRRCFRAPEGRKLVIADYSQIELRILADFTGDDGFITAFNSGADLHRVTAAQVFNVPLEEVTADQRSFAKRLNFGVVYGIGAQRFSMMTGLSQTESEDLLRRYFATYRALDTWLRDAALRALRERAARTASGRLARFNFDPADKQAASLAQRNGKNTPIQGCLQGDARIFEESRGYIPIKEMAGQKVTVWDGTKFSKALVAYSGKKQKVRVTLWGGHYIECSPDHKFLVIDANGRQSWRTPLEFKKLNWVVLTDEINEWSGDLLIPKPQSGSAWNSSKASLADISDKFELGVFLGRTASDGSVSERQVTNLVAEHEREVLPYLQAIAGQLGHVTIRLMRREQGLKPLYQLTNSSLGVARQLLQVGIKDRIPDVAWRDRRVLAGYLRGVFDGDGTVNKDGALLTFGKGPDFHLPWAREVQQALLLFGIRSRINQCASGRINVCVLKRDMPLFSDRIGFINSVKQKKALAIKDGTGHKNRIYGRAARIKSVEITDEWVDMYDVVNSESGRFMANGLVVHNSSADILKRALRLLHDKLRGTNACIVNMIHDEIVVEADAAQAEEMSKIVEDAMCKAGEEYVKKVPVKVETEVADAWVK